MRNGFKMKITVVALGALLVGCGAVSIWMGMDIVQIERGWTQVIAGATVMSAGFVVIALGLVIGSLEALRTALFVLRADAAPAEPADSPAAKPGPPPEPVTVIPPAAEIKTAPVMNIIPANDPAPAAETPVAQKRAADAEATRAALAMAKPELPPRLKTQSAGESHPPREESDPHEWLERAISGGGAVDPALEWLRPGFSKAERQHARDDARDTAASLKTFAAGVKDPAAAPAQERFFESNGVTYTLHADGSITADSPDGRFHFANMDELREHLAWRNGGQPAPAG